MSENSVEIEIINSEEVTEQLKKMMEKNPKFRPVLLTVEDPNAIFVEFGTRPAKRTAFRTGEAFKKIHYWAENKEEVRRGSKRDTHDFAYRVYKDIMENGMIPQPFFRPAVHEFQDKLKNNPSEFEGKTPSQIARDLREEMINILRDNKTPFEYRIDQSIMIEILSSPDDVPVGREIVSQEIMDSDVLDVMGRDRSGSLKWHAKRR